MPRLGLVIGGLGAVLLTPSFALSFFLSYGVPDEPAPGWLSSLAEPLTSAGLLDPGSYDAYDGHGLLYLACWSLALGGLVARSRHVRPGWSPRLRRGWSVLTGGLAAVLVGILGDYGAPTEVAGFLGFLVTGIGFLVASAGCVMVGWALHRDSRVGRPGAAVVGGLGLVSTVGGLALVGHIPSGPGLGFAVAAVILGVTRFPSRQVGTATP